ncbi:MAG: MerR family transcriptional regulator [Candidatus Izemoplasmatales bacterium]|nr:MerR family transcriptional regulator [Candidatus Izemoplasmatales bacterium]
MYTMKEVCNLTNLNYETLKYYCNQGLIPNLKRDKNNYRIFSKMDVEWIKGLKCLKKCDLSIKQMKTYVDLCFEGDSSIPMRKKILADQKTELLEQLNQIKKSLTFIDYKQKFYDDVLLGKIESFNGYEIFD